MHVDIKSDADMKTFGAKLGALLAGGEVIELIGDVGAGKTTLTKGIAAGLGVDEDVQSPSFTISRTYPTATGTQLAHYDFYRLTDAGIMAHDLQESVADSHVVTVVEWGDIVEGVLPVERLSLTLTPVDESTRQLEAKAVGYKYQQILEGLA